MMQRDGVGRFCKLCTNDPIAFAFGAGDGLTLLKGDIELMLFGHYTFAHPEAFGIDVAAEERRAAARRMAFDGRQN